MKLSIITPTINRDSLWRLIEQTKELLRPGEDEHIIIHDTNLAIPASSGVHRHLAHRDPASFSGNAQRDLGIESANGDCLVFCDDDDLLGEAAIKELQALPADGRFRMFAAVDEYKGSPRFYFGSMQKNMACGAQIVPPRSIKARWMDHNCYEADYTMMERCKEQFGPPLWSPTVLAWIRP
jgi:glycosyltransferase involved in cell wall biosynthesis